MSKYVPDIASKRWVIISPQRIGRPENNGDNSHTLCPFCPGNEKLTSDEVARFEGSNKRTKAWQVRVIKNKYPITDFHEVIIHSPDCDKDIENLSLPDASLIFAAYHERYNFYRKKGQVLIFCNHGEHAGASIKHPHSQLVVIPAQINLDALSREPLNNIVDENTFFNVYCPDFSQWPYEVWIAPKKENTFFGDMNDDEIKDLVAIVQKMLKRLEHMYHHHRISSMPFGYNYYIYPKENWYLRIIPRFVHRAGFELGTGLSVNIIDPLDASLELKGVEEKTKRILDRLRKQMGKTI